MDYMFSLNNNNDDNKKHIFECICLKTMQCSTILTICINV